ncbi:hypothetical protein E2542_SST17493 [Spatholobus suberectus]|nr:hypothetical protein E2542_SST17493 [Spatholobus suberectus]
MGYTEERTGVSSHVDTTGSDHDHLFLRNSLGRDNKFGKPFRWHHFGSWTVLRAMGKEQRANAESLLVRLGGGIGIE